MTALTDVVVPLLCDYYTSSCPASSFRVVARDVLLVLLFLW